MKKIIISSNEWFDNLPELKRDLFFLIVVMGSLIGAQFLTYVIGFIWAVPIWMIIFGVWRVGYLFIRKD